MRPGRPSRTAQHNALFRAMETRRPRDLRLLDDPLAEAFLTGPLRLGAVLSGFRWWREPLIRLIDRRWPGVRSTVVARTRLIDESIASVVGSSPQVVVLGAGFDTRVWRLPCLAGVAVYEVDHPDTQRHKRRVLARRGLLADDGRVRFVPTDFHLGRLGSAMAGAGYQASLPTLFLWEGTTNYLDAAAVDATLRWCAEAAAGSWLIFTYIHRAVLDDPSSFVGAERLFATLRRTDERMTFGLDPDDLAGHLAERGLELESDTGASAFRARCYGDAAAGIRGHEFYRVARARIGSREGDDEGFPQAGEVEGQVEGRALG